MDVLEGVRRKQKFKEEPGRLRGGVVGIVPTLASNQEVLACHFVDGQPRIPQQEHSASWGASGSTDVDAAYFPAGQLLY